MIRIQPTVYKDRFNLIDDDKPKSDESRYIRQVSTKELIYLGESIIQMLKEK